MSILKSFLETAVYTGEKAYERLLDKHITLGVTGLSGSGKSSFITSLIYQLVNFHSATLPSFSPINQNRFLGCKLKSTGQPDVRIFDYNTGIQLLSQDEPEWPVSTIDSSALVLEIRFKPRSSFLPSFGSSYSRLFLEIRDYPGEWLLDLPLLSQSYFNWSQESGFLFKQEPRSKLIGNLQPLLDSINPLAIADADLIKNIHHEYVTFLKRCKSEGLSLVQPGRFLIPGDTNKISSPFIPLTMLSNYEEKELENAKAGSYYDVLKNSYDDYIKDQVKPFYNEYFSSIDSQVVLVDVLNTLNKGQQCMDDLKMTMARVLDSFQYGQNNIISRLFSPKVSKVVLAASKIDQVLPEQHENVRALISAIVRDIYRNTHYEQVDVFTEAFAAVRCTEVVHRNENIYLQGRVDDGQQGLISHPSIPERIPTDSEWLAFNEWPLRVLRPPINPGLKYGEALPHIRMDTILRELIGDKF